MQPFIPESLPIAALSRPPPEIIKASGEANRALARFDALVAHSPNPRLLLAPLTRREALLSSRIEGSQSTLNEVLQFEEDGAAAARGEKRDDLSEIRNYIAALNLGAATLAERPFSLHILKELHAKLLGAGSVRGQTKNPGNFRARQNWIGVPGMLQEQATFVPPDPLLVPELMEKWARFYHADQPDILVQAAVLHAQFELIHPFEDGNGRLGRLVIPLFLYEKNAVGRPNFYLSAYLERHRDAYMAALKQLNARPGEWGHWALFFLNAVAAQATEDYQKTGRMMALYDDMKSRFVDITRSRFAVPVLDAIFEKPVFSRAHIQKSLRQMERPPSAPTVGDLLKKLARHDVLQVSRDGHGRRAAIYVFGALMELLDGA